MRNIFVVCLAALALPSLAAAQDTTHPPDCSTPRRAALTWLANLQADNDFPELAIACWDWDAAGVQLTQERIRVARELKLVLDQRGHRVDMDALPDVAEVPEEQLEDDKVILHPRTPEAYFVRADNGSWVVSEHSIRAVPALYDATFDVDVEAFVETLPDWMRAQPVANIAVWQLLLLFVGLLLGLVVRAIVTGVVSKYGARLIEKQSSIQADSAILKKASKPLGTLALTGVLWWVFPLLRFGLRFNQVTDIALRVISASAAVLLVYRLVDLGSDVFARRAEETDTKLDDQIVPLIRKTLKVFVVAVGLIFVLQNMDVDVGSLLAGVSLGGLAFSFAARDTVANLFGSVSIFADQPFQVGDWVVIDGHEGVVEEVGMRSSRIRTFYDSVICIPNSVVANSAIDNYGKRRYRRCTFTLGVTYDSSPDQMQAFVEGIRGILKANPDVRKDAYEVHFRNFGDSALEIFVYFFFTVDTWSKELQTRANVLMQIMRLASELNLDFAFPTQTVHVETLAEGKEIPERETPEEAALAASIAGFGPDGDGGLVSTPWRKGGFFAEPSAKGNEDDADGDG